MGEAESEGVIAITGFRSLFVPRRQTVNATLANTPLIKVRQTAIF
jgi:hypothetical protein